MSKEAPMKETEAGRCPSGPGWFVLNLADCAWKSNERFGLFSDFKGEAAFDQVGWHVHVLQPGQPNCKYHREDAQEDFLVLSGEALLIVEGEERKLRAWDVVHFPPETEHVFVGAGSSPCAILMMGAVRPGRPLFYPSSELARKHGAGVEQETPNPQEAYAGSPPSQPVRSPWSEVTGA